MFQFLALIGVMFFGLFTPITYTSIVHEKSPCEVIEDVEEVGDIVEVQNQYIEEASEDLNLSD